MEALTFFAAIGLLIAGIVMLGRMLGWILLHTNIGMRDFSKMDPDEIVVIARSIDSTQARKWQAVVKSSGIHCMVTDPVIPTYGRGGAGIDPTHNIEVRAADAKRAIEVLEKAMRT